MSFLVGVSFIILWGCSKNDNLVSSTTTTSNELKSPSASSEINSSKAVETTIDFVYTGQTPDGTFTGTFTAHGGLETSGSSTMIVNAFGNVAHCSQTLIAPEGTITILSNCQFSTMEGSWRVESGTGAYSSLKGNGKLLMTFPEGVFVVESYSGQVKY